MKCLSVSQPFADLIVNGKKTIELRSWNTNFRGEFLVHAPHKIRLEDCKRLKMDGKLLHTGSIVGSAELFDIKKYTSISEIKKDEKLHLAEIKFSKGRCGFLLKNAKKIKTPIPIKGQLRFFDVKIENTKKNTREIKRELFDEEYRYQWINHH